MIGMIGKCIRGLFPRSCSVQNYGGFDDWAGGPRGVYCRRKLWFVPTKFVTRMCTFVYRIMGVHSGGDLMNGAQPILPCRLLASCALLVSSASSITFKCVA